MVPQMPMAAISMARELRLFCFMGFGRSAAGAVIPVLGLLDAVGRRGIPGRREDEGPLAEPVGGGGAVRPGPV